MLNEGGSRSRHRSSSKWSRRHRATNMEPSPTQIDDNNTATRSDTADDEAGGGPRPPATPPPLWVPADDVPMPMPMPAAVAGPQPVPRSSDTSLNGEETVSIQTELSRVVSELRRSIPELNGAMVASVDGLSVAHDFPEADAERMAAMASTALGLGQRISDRTSLGEMQETVVRGDHGYLVVYAAGEQAVLVLAGPFNANLGLMRIEARAASTEISKLLG